MDWQTLVPAAGTLIFTIDQFDRRVSDYAVNHHPGFGSENDAKTASDVFDGSTYVEAIGIALATPSGHDWEEWKNAKAKGLGVEFLRCPFSRVEPFSMEILLPTIEFLTVAGLTLPNSAGA